VLGGLALGAAVLLHPWMLAMALPFAVVWCLERTLAGRPRDAAWLVLGALPAMLALGGYDAAVNGNALRPNYAVTGEAFRFGGLHFREFFLFYAVSLAIFPLAGWAGLSRRNAQGWALPAAIMVVVIGASLYDYRDGLTSGLHGIGALIAGAVPGQRFLLPASVIACVPAARYLDGWRKSAGEGWTKRWRAAALATFIAGYALVGAMHQSFLRANAAVQIAIARAVPERARLIGNGGILKELAPVFRNLDFRPVDASDARAARESGAYVAWLVAPDAPPPAAIFAGRRSEKVQARSWVWNRDLWIGYPAAAPPAERQ
jgi:hypothetical protein